MSDHILKSSIIPSSPTSKTPLSKKILYSDDQIKVGLIRAAGTVNLSHIFFLFERKLVFGIFSFLFMNSTDVKFFVGSTK